MVLSLSSNPCADLRFFLKFDLRRRNEGKKTTYISDTFMTNARPTIRGRITIEQQNKIITEAVHSLKGARIEIRAKATEKGGLFKSITAADILKAIQIFGY